MQTSTLLHRNLTYYWRTNLAVIFGVAAAVAVLAGALLVGDSVRNSLRDLVLDRLGKTDYVISATSFFREKLADDLQADSRFAGNFGAACPIIIFEGVVAHQESGRRASGVQVYGVDDRFWKFHGQAGAPPGEREILASAGLAEELGIKAVDALLLTVEKPSAIPLESLHGRKDEVGRTVRLSVREMLPASGLGEFSIRPQQGAVRAVFVALKQLQKDLEQPDKVNAILVSGRDQNANGQQAQRQMEEALRTVFRLEDLGIKLRILEDQQCISLESDSALISDSLADTARVAADELGLRASSVLTYLANTMRVGQREVPYSLITALDRESYARLKGGHTTPATTQPATAQSFPPILLNDWAASDLGAKPGDELTIEYYVWLDEGRLDTRTARFRIDGIIPIKGAAADRNLAPEYPGITETESLSDWDPPFPMDLGRIRQSDEDYWDRHRTTPKAFIPLEAGQELWQTRYGKLTSMRFFPAGQSSSQEARDAYAKQLRAALDPIVMGMSVYPARSQGLQASRGATDFGEYFVYFSFFLVVSALLLAGLFFKLGVEQRLREIGVLRALGFNAAKTRAIFLMEGIFLAAAGSLLGVIGAVAYGWLIMLGLRTWWVGAVGTTLLKLHVSPTSLAFGAAGALLAAIVWIAWTLRRLAPASPRSLLAGELDYKEKGKRQKAKVGGVSYLLLFAFCLTLLGLLLLAGAIFGWVGQVGGFFGAGGLFLVAILCYVGGWLRRRDTAMLHGNGWWAVSRLGFRNATYRPGRSVLCIALIASATFIIVAVDAFRRDSRETSLDKKSGTGGYTLLAESLLPIAENPNTPEGRESLNLASAREAVLDGVTFTRLRLRPGDDASCLNLYQPRNPRILAPADDFIQSNRFAFQDSLATTDEEKANPWLLLNKELPDGAVPVIADANSMTYVLHLKLGDEFVMTSGGSPIRMRLVAALADSIFQGELLMAEKNFLRLFPEQEGYRFFLMDAAPEKAPAVAGILEEQLVDFGFDAVPTGERLATFHRVENTYLSTFQALGGLGLLLGTLGLAAVLMRNILERRRELALLRAIGYNQGHFRLMAIAENALLLLCGLIAGAGCALLAITPALLARGGHLPTVSLGLLMAVLLAGLAASLAAVAAVSRSPLLATLRAE
ncbi:MAG TPA: FtsX-like permease family protein [Blastocatellia bacterium]|nr:FtsX-like permease family protein [Blastocatellia bacterium]